MSELEVLRPTPTRSALVAFLPAVVAAVLTTAACSPDLSEREAERLVRAYNTRLMEAYRAGDAQLMEGLVGDEEAMKLTGLIGVKLDMGITLDAALQQFLVVRIERGEGSVDLVSEERWHYRDRRIGSGETVGQESTDDYIMRYVLREHDGAWRVDAVRFETPPEVGRSKAPNEAPLKAFHGIEAPSNAGARNEPDTTGEKR